MERETKEIKISSGKAIVLKTYLTGREANAIKEVMLNQMKMDVETGKPVNAEISGAFLIEQERKLLETIVVSIDGVKAENPTEQAAKILDLKNDEYQEVVRAVNEIYNANLTQAK